jgi:hypothetical protein
VSSAQCRSSRKISTGRSRASDSSRRRTAQAISSGARARRRADRTGEPRDDQVRLRHTGQEREQLLARRVAGVAVLDPRERLQHDREREVRDALAVRDAAALEHGRALADDGCELVREP